MVGLLGHVLHHRYLVVYFHRTTFHRDKVTIIDLGRSDGHDKTPSLYVISVVNRNLIARASFITENPQHLPAWVGPTTSTCQTVIMSLCIFIVHFFIVIK